MTTVATLSPTLVENLGRCRAPASEACTLPPECYHDAAIHQLERDAIFRRGWVGVGRHDRWATAGQFVAVDIGEVPVVVLRDAEGDLQAFANTCRHRGAQIMVGEGECTKLRCPFHFWTYGLDGRLLGAPSMHETADFDRAEHGLISFPVAERFGFVFVSLESDPTPIDEWLGDFGVPHAPWPLATLVTGRRREFTVDCNWKAFAEVFNEYYHLPYVHPTSIDDTYHAPDPPEPATGAYATQFGTTSGTGGLLEEDQHLALPLIETLGGRNAEGVRYSWLFPNLMIAAGVEGMWMYEVYPDGPDRSRCAQVVCFPAETTQLPDFAERAEHYYERFDVAVAEDIPMLEQQHAGLRSPFADQGRFSAGLEPSVAAFANWYATRLLEA